MLQLRGETDRAHRTLRQHFASLDEHQVRRQPQHLLVLVADIDHRDREPVTQGLQVRQHLFAARDVDRGERFIEQQQARLRQQRAPERHALPLAPGELVRASREQRLKTEEREHLVKANEGRTGACPLRPIAQISRDTQVRKEACVLKHVADAAALRGHVDARLRVGEHLLVQ